MKLRQEQLKLQILLKETITLLCKNGLEFNNGFVVNALIGITTDDSETFLVKLEEKVGDVTGDGDTDDMISNRSADGRGRRSRALRKAALRKRRTGRNDDVTPTKRQRADSDDDDSRDEEYESNYEEDSGNDDDVNDVKSEPDNGNIIFVEQAQSTYNDHFTQSNQVPDDVGAPPGGSVDGGSHDGSLVTLNRTATDNDTNIAGSQQVCYHKYRC